MNKSFNFKKWSSVAATSIAMAMSGGAYAAIQTGFDGDPGSEKPEVFLAIWDVTAPKTYVQDLGLDAGTIDWTTYSNTFTFDATQFAASGIGSSAPANLRFAVFAAVAANDFQSGGLWSTAAPGDVNNWFTTDPLQHGQAITNLDDLSNAHNQLLAQPEAYANNFATQGNSGALVIPGTGFPGAFEDGASPNSPAGSALGDVLQWFQITWIGDNGNLLRSTFGTWETTLTSATYNPGGGVGAPIPLPAGIWLLGSALLGLVGVARRRVAQQTAH